MEGDLSEGEGWWARPGPGPTGFRLVAAGPMTLQLTEAEELELFGREVSPTARNPSPHHLSEVLGVFLGAGVAETGHPLLMVGLVEEGHHGLLHVPQTLVRHLDDRLAVRCAVRHRPVVRGLVEPVRAVAL